MYIFWHNQNHRMYMQTVFTCLIIFPLWLCCSLHVYDLVLLFFAVRLISCLHAVPQFHKTHTKKQQQKQKQKQTHHTQCTCTVQEVSIKCVPFAWQWRVMFTVLVRCVLFYAVRRKVQFLSFYLYNLERFNHFPSLNWTKTLNITLAQHAQIQLTLN